MKIPALVELTWVDAHFDNAAAIEMPKYEPVTRYSVGYYLGEQNDAIGVAQTVDFNGDGGNIMFQDMLWIPARTVTRKRVIRRASV
jgi:hypothetical protein